MKKSYILTLVLLPTFFLSFGQIPNWELDLATYTNFFTYLGQIKETENSLFFTKKHTIHEVSYYGEPITETNFSFDIADDTFSAINTIVKKNINGTEIYASSINDGLDLFFCTSSLEGEQLAPCFKIALNGIPYHRQAPTAVFERPNNEFVVFGTSEFYTIKLNDDYSWEITNNVNHYYSGINSIKEAGNNFIITTTNLVILVSENLEPLWETNTSLNIKIGSKISDGYIVCSNNNIPGFNQASVVKLSNTGAIEWQIDYEGKIVNDIIPWNGKILLVGNKIFTIDYNGNIIWEKELPVHKTSIPPFYSPTKDLIYKVQKSQFGDILLMGGNKLYSLNMDSDKPFSDFHSLTINKIANHITPYGNLGGYESGTEFPANSGISIIHKDAPTFIGQTESGTLKGFYRLGYFEDIFTGVLSPTPTTWKISQKEIDIIQQRYGNGESLAPYSQSMLTYPAKGNPHCIINEETISITNDFAPFIDANGDGIYNMFDGDYPKMKGDQMIWWAIKHTSSNLEMHGTWYAFDCGEHIVSNTVYVEYEIFNKSVDNLPICFFGKYTDFDLGCPNDDYMGSLPDVNAYYGYNQDGVDSSAFDCHLYYGTEIPIQSVTFLDNEMTSAIYHNGGYGNPPLGTLRPESHEEGSNYLQAIFKDGTPLTYGDSGYTPESSNTTAFAYPGNPANAEEWSMISANLGTVDYRVIGSTGAFSLNAGDSKTFTFAYTTHLNIPHPAPDVTPVAESIQQITEIHDNGNAFAQVFLGQDQAIATGETITLNAGDNELEYVWSTDEDGASIQVSAPGTYAVTVIDETGCQRSDEITINQATGLSNIEITQLAVYPNPAQSGTNISIELPTMEEISMVKLFNIVGQEMYSEKLSIHTQQLDVALSNAFSAGIYVVQLTSVDGKVMVGKVVIE